MQAEPDQNVEKPEPARKPATVLEPDFERPITPIAELLTRPDFPKSALGEYVDIGGYAGVVVQIVNQSLKVRSPDGVTQSFNSNGLRRIYGPVIRPEPTPERGPDPAPPASPPSAPLAPPPPQQPPSLEPDFSKPVRPIVELVSRRDFPGCALGEHIEIGDYVGVVVQIVNHSLKVRSQTETTRSYNAEALRKLHGGK